MKENTLLEFKNAVDEEIKAYEAMEELYKVKQAILVQGKSDALWDVDAKIVQRMDGVKQSSAKRKEIAKYLGDENMTISEAISKAQKSNREIAANLENQKIKLNALSGSIQILERTNMDLIKHGLVMAGKTLNIIVNALLPATTEYNNLGRNVQREEMQISSVVEEA